MGVGSGPAFSRLLSLCVSPHAFITMPISRTLPLSCLEPIVFQIISICRPFSLALVIVVIVQFRIFVLVLVLVLVLVFLVDDLP